MHISIHYKNYEFVLSLSNTKVLDQNGSVLYTIDNKGLNKSLLVSSIIAWFRIHKSNESSIDLDELRNFLMNKIPELSDLPSIFKKMEEAEEAERLKYRRFKNDDHKQLVVHHTASNSRVSRVVDLVDDYDVVKTVQHINAQTPFKDIVNAQFVEQLSRHNLTDKAKAENLVFEVALFGTPYRRSIIFTLFESSLGRFEKPGEIREFFPNNPKAVAVLDNKIVLQSNNLPPKIYETKSILYLFSPRVMMSRDGKYTLGEIDQLLLDSKRMHIVFVVPETTKQMDRFKVVLNYVLNNFAMGLIFVFVSFDKKDLIRPARDLVVKYVDTLTENHRKKVVLLDFNLFTFTELKTVLDHANILQIKYFM